MIRDVSGVVFGAFRVGHESLSAVGALLFISSPSQRGGSIASTPWWGALLATCSSPLRSIWASVESSSGARGEN